MKNTYFTSRTTDFQILKVLAWTGFSALFGALFPLQLDQCGCGSFDTTGIIFCVSLAIFVWAFFHMIQPLRHGRGWEIIGYFALPLIWLALVTASYWWFHYLQQRDFIEWESMQNAAS